MILPPLDLEFGAKHVFKLAVATSLNYLCLWVVRYPEGWFHPDTGILYANIHAGVAFLTILLLGAAGAVACGTAFLLHFAQLTAITNWFGFFSVILLATGSQYLVIRVVQYRYGLSSTLRGLNLRNLLTLGCIFSLTFALSMALIQDDLQNIVPMVVRTAIHNYLGVLLVLLTLKAASKLGRLVIDHV